MSRWAERGLLLLAACSWGAPAVEAADAPGASKTPARVVAFGDVHGDLKATQQALKLGGLSEDGEHWSGGTTVAVQVGDQLDRGDDERAILELFERLRTEAEAAGGAFVPLLGNHEVMNVAGDLRYVTPGGFADFADLADPALTEVPEAARGRVSAFKPGGPWAKRLADHPVTVVAGDSLFVHGGVLPDHVTYGLDRIDTEAAAWMRGEAPMPAVLSGEDAPVWTRAYSQGPDADDCTAAKRVLERLELTRMVVAHTPSKTGILPACDGLVWRVDTGMSRHYGGPVQVLVIEDGVVSVVR